MKETRNFTLRLGPEECAALEQIKIITGTNTDSGAIKHVLRSFEELSRRYHSELEKNRNMSYELKDLKRKVNNFLDAFNSLKGGKDE